MTSFWLSEVGSTTATSWIQRSNPKLERMESPQTTGSFKTYMDMLGEAEIGEAEMMKDAMIRTFLDAFRNMADELDGHLDERAITLQQLAQMADTVEWTIEVVADTRRKIPRSSCCNHLAPEGEESAAASASQQQSKNGRGSTPVATQ